MNKVLRAVISGIIGFIGILFTSKLYEIGIIPRDTTGIFNIIYTNLEIIVFGLIAALSFFTISIPISKKISKKLEKVLVENPLQDILIYIISVAIGLLVANLIGDAFARDEKYTIFVILLYVALGYLGGYIAQLKSEEIKGWFVKKGTITGREASPKILDTSVIIDGRIIDILKTEFIEGKIVIPIFVLEELRHIADSSDALKRNRGRRGLDILNEIQAQLEVDVEIVEKDYKSIKEVDSKLLKLAEELNGAIVTNDYNLNKVANFQKVNVLNINELANSVKPIVLPGEEMQLLIVKEGKENSQGIGYLNDGTMIVVENGKKYVGEMKDIVVTTVLQTAAGRMIFGKLK